MIKIKIVEVNGEEEHFKDMKISDTIHDIIKQTRRKRGY